MYTLIGKLVIDLIHVAVSGWLIGRFLKYYKSGEYQSAGLNLATAVYVLASCIISMFS